MNRKKKVLILSITAGFGHIRAGDALLDYTKEHLPNIQAKHVNISDISPFFKEFIAKFYSVSSKELPFIWKIIYKYKLFFLIIKKFIILNGLFNTKIKEYLKKEDPDFILLTNTLLIPMIVFASRKILPDIKIGVIITDYYGHPSSYFPSINYYFVANEKVKGDLGKIGVTREKIIVTGIPINPRFYIQENISELKSKYGIKNDLPIVLFIASFKISKKDLLSVMKRLLGLQQKINLIFIANGNDKIFNLIKDDFGECQRFHLVNWTNVIEEYIKISDVVISKAGGLTVTECLTLKKPMIIVNPIPGQEEYNAEFVEQNNFGKKVKNVSEIIDILPKMILLSKSEKISLLPQENPCKKIFQYFE